ncbi:MAG: aminoacyl-tRNA hydrolase, partial [Pseudomonadota bacterium]
LTGVGEGISDLLDGDQGRFLNAVARRVAPARPSTGQQKPKGTPKADAGSTAPPAPEPAPEAPRSALQRLVDKFR